VKVVHDKKAIKFQSKKAIGARGASQKVKTKESQIKIAKTCYLTSFESCRCFGEEEKKEEGGRCTDWGAGARFFRSHRDVALAKVAR